MSLNGIYATVALAGGWTVRVDDEDLTVMDVRDTGDGAWAVDLRDYRGVPRTIEVAGTDEDVPVWEVVGPVSLNPRN